MDNSVFVLFGEMDLGSMSLKGKTLFGYIEHCSNPQNNTNTQPKKNNEQTFRAF